MADEKTTVGELIAALRQFPADMRVVVPGVEDGYDDVTVAQRMTVVTYRKASSAYVGKHRDVNDAPCEDVIELPTSDVVVLRYGG